MSRASGGLNTLQRDMSNIPDPLRTKPVKVSVKDGKISNYQLNDDGRRSERFGAVGIVDVHGTKHCSNFTDKIYIVDF